MFQSQDGTYAMKKVLILIKEQLGLVREEFGPGHCIDVLVPSAPTFAWDYR